MKSILPKSFFIFFAVLELKNFLYVKILFLFAIFAGSDAGSIPITKNHTTFSNFSDLPILFVDSYEDINKELLETYKLVAQNEGIGISFEPAAAITEALKRAKGKAKEYIICATACGRVEKDLDVIESLIGKDFE